MSEHFYKASSQKRGVGRIGAIKTNAGEYRIVETCFGEWNSGEIERLRLCPQFPMAQISA